MITVVNMWWRITVRRCMTSYLKRAAPNRSHRLDYLQHTLASSVGLQHIMRLDAAVLWRGIALDGITGFPEHLVFRCMSFASGTKISSCTIQTLVDGLYWTLWSTPEWIHRIVLCLGGFRTWPDCWHSFCSVAHWFDVDHILLVWCSARHSQVIFIIINRKLFDYIFLL